MSRIGKKPVKIPSGVKLSQDGNKITVTGPKGTLNVDVDPIIKFEISADEVQFSRGSDIKREKAMHGLYAVLLKNLITGVTDGYSKRLDLVGIGFRAEYKNQKLFMSLGFSHPIIFYPPEGIKIDLQSDTAILISGIDKQLVGQVAAKIRSFKPPEPYKGKGIKYEGEYIRRKAGKAAAK
jgi:large subunit ribosomal protein L6